MEELERRASAGHAAIETRTDGKDYIVFTPIVFGKRSQLLGGWFFEQIDPRALDECDLSNVIGPFNHDENQILGRSQAGTLSWTITATDVQAAIPVDTADPDHVRVAAKIRRGDVRGASFAFMIAPGGADWDTDPVSGVEVRTVKKIAVLVDMSPVVNPAYLQTTAGMGKRSLEAIREERDAFVAESSVDPPADNTTTQDTTPEHPAAPDHQAEHDRMLMELTL